MSPQRSNREALIDGALQCLAENPAANVTARDIANRSNANLASIGYHFGSKNGLLAEAMVEGFRRWFGEVALALAELPLSDPSARLRRAVEVVSMGAERHVGLARAFLAALASAPHDVRVRGPLAESYRESRVAVAGLIGLGEDEAGEDAAGLLLALFDGLLIQALLDPSRELSPARVASAQARLADL
jgi:AcrR family transcriptional regulator